VNNGQSVSPYFITRIVSRNQEILEEYRPKAGNQVVSSDNAQLMVHMLKRTINEGTGASMRWKYNIKNDMAGKTGTTQSNADGWFMAMTPNLVIGSWVGADDPRIRFRSTSLGQGASTALPIVAGFFQQVNSDKQLSTISRAQLIVISINRVLMYWRNYLEKRKRILPGYLAKRRSVRKKVFSSACLASEIIRYPLPIFA
jgi:penicillin-binding protein 1A